MKIFKLNILQIFILLFSITVISCSTDPLSEMPQNSAADTNFFNMTTERDRFIASDFDSLGIKHNQILTSLYNKLYLDKLNNTNEITNSNSLALYLKREITAENYNITIEKDEPSIQESVDYGIANFQNINIQDLDIENPKVTEYLINLERIVRNGVDVQVQILDLETKIENDMDLKNRDLYTLFSATSIGKHSHDYWSKNLNLWLENLNTTEELNSLENNYATRAGCSWFELEGPNSCIGQLLGTVIITDMITGAGVALGVAVVNFIPGAQVPYVTTVVVSSVGASAAAGMWFLVEQYRNS